MEASRGADLLGKTRFCGGVHEASFVWAGVRFDFELKDPESLLLAALSRRLPPPEPKESFRAVPGRRYAVMPAADGSAHLVVRRGSRRPAIASGLEAAADLIANDVQRIIALRAPGLLAVHAGAVVWRGRAILLPGRSGCGKSTLVAALLERGVAYFSDELALLDESGRVHPYRRHLVLKDGARVERIAPVALGSSAYVSGDAVPLSTIAVLRYRPGARWSLTALSPGGALLALLHNTVAARTRLDLAHRALREVTRVAAAWKGMRGEAGEAADALLEP